MNQYTLAKSVDPRVYAVFEKLTRDCDDQKRNKILDYTKELVKEGKKLERALADSLEKFKLTGSVDA